MATTFRIENQDVVIGNTNGRPKITGNELNENDPAKATAKSKQDLRRGLSLATVKNGTTANIQSLVGNIPTFGTSYIAILINRQIRSMFAAILSEQRRRNYTRPPRERFVSISTLTVIPEADRTSYRFRLGVRTADRGVTEISAVVG